MSEGEKVKDFDHSLQALLTRENIINNPTRESLIEHAVRNKEALLSSCGALATWTPTESTGRSPLDTLTVRRAESEGNIDWDSPNNIPIDERTFDMVIEDALATLEKKERLYITDRVLGADSAYALPVKTISDQALTALFTDNMFRPIPSDIAKSVFGNRPFIMLVLPYDKLDPKRYEGRLRIDPRIGGTSTMVIGMDYDRGIGVVYGSAYGGSVKKLMFTVMNYLLPAEGILPLHCSANEGENGDSALLLGLSGTGKTTLSADPRRALLGDDEHGWSDDGIANFENGCYAKLIDLDPKKEPEIYNAVMHEDDYRRHGSIVENAMFYPSGEFDLYDDRLTPNSRASYPLAYLTNIKESSTSGHPKTILFLTADANGVIPPISKLTKEQAMLWFLMGYTSKLAGTETGIVEPKSTFSRFFGEPFMPRNPDVYARLLGDKMEKHGTTVYLVNTGWSGGPYGIGKRMDINLTRAMVHAALTGALANVQYDENEIFHVLVPRTCPDAPSEILNPRNTWQDVAAYDARASKLASEFAAHFDKAYGNKGIDEAIVRQCPGK
ncbi:MAG TPA: phosphoenolpyruvate carboxykinase (ATP) [Candidatus Acetothermia bacterium]|nr:phosphoenolpyruvate carboxykinase (ATP) [Candidatus Acetothermia bacterium]